MTDVTVTLNGKPRQVPEGISLLELLKELDVQPSRVVIEHNREIRRKDDFKTARVRDGDELELVYFVGGGAPAGGDPFARWGGAARARAVPRTRRVSPNNRVPPRPQAG